MTPPALAGTLPKFVLETWMTIQKLISNLGRAGEGLFPV